MLDELQRSYRFLLFTPLSSYKLPCEFLLLHKAYCSLFTAYHLPFPLWHTTCSQSVGKETLYCRKSQGGKEWVMRGKNLTIVFACIMLLLFLGGKTEAAYFVFTKKGNIRSGPGTNYRVIGQLAKETIAEIPETFTDYEAKWIAIDAKTELDKKTKAEKVVFTKWAHRSLGVVIQGDLDEVDKYFAVKESGWSKEMQHLVLAGKVVVGMNSHMVFYAWGRPDVVNESPNLDKQKQEWIYKRPGGKIHHLYFQDDILKSLK